MQENLNTLIISSPSEGFTLQIAFRIEKIQNSQTPVKLGKEYFLTFSLVFLES
jgi:hypothetical protein